MDTAILQMRDAKAQGSRGEQQERGLIGSHKPDFGLGTDREDEGIRHKRGHLSSPWRCVCVEGSPGDQPFLGKRARG